jgi:hypothetical protein
LQDVAFNLVFLCKQIDLGVCMRHWSDYAFHHRCERYHHIPRTSKTKTM